MQGPGMSAQQKLQQQRSKPKRLVSLRRDDIVSVDVKEKTLVLRDGLTIKLRGEDVARCIPGCPAFGVPFDDASSVYRKDGVVKALGLAPGCGTRCAEASIPDSAFRSLVSRRNSMLRGLKPDGFMPWYVVSATLVEYSGTAVNWAEEVALRMTEALAALKDGAKKLKFEAEILNMVNLKAEEEEARAAAELVVPGGEQLQLPEGVLPVDGTAGLREAGAVCGELEIEGGVGTYKKEVVVVREVEVVGEAGLRVVGGIVGSASVEGNAVGAVVEGNAVVGGLGIGGKGGEDAALTAGAMLLLSEREGTGAGVQAAGSGLPLRKEEGGSEWREVCVQDKCKLNRHDLTNVVVELACGPASPAVQVGGVVEGRQLRSREIKTTVVEKLPTRSVAKAAAQVLAKAFSEMDTRCRKKEEQCKQLEVDGSERQVEKGVSEQEGAEAKAKAEADALAKAEAEADALAKAEDDALAKAEADALARAEADALAKAEADALARAEADALARAEADALAKAGADALAKAEADALAKAEAEALAKAKAEAEAKARARAEAEAKAKAKAESEAFNALMQAEEEKLAKAREEKNGLLRRFNMIGARAAVAEQEKRGVIRQIIECSAAGRKLMADRDNVLAEIMKDMKATQEARLVKVAQMHVKRRKLEEVKASYEEITKSHTSQIWELEKAVVDQGYGVESMHKQWQEHSHKVEEHKRSEAKLEVSLAKAEEALAVLEEEKNKLVVELQEQHARMKLLRSKFMPEDDIPDVLDINTIEIEALLLAADERDMEPFAGNNKRKHPDTDRDFRRRPQETERDVGGLRQRARTSENGGGKRALRGSSAVV